MLRILPLMALGISVLFLTAYGAGIYPWTVCAVLFALSVANLAVYAKPRSTALFQKRRLTLPALYAALLIFIAIVLMPLPLSLSRLTGSLRFEQNTCVAETLEEAKALGIETPPLVTFSTSRSRAGTLRALLLLATLFGAWKLAQQLDPALRQLWLRGLIGLGSVVAVLGHLGKWVIPQGNTLWWAIPVPPVLPGPVGGFINPNHFAGFVALLAPVALAMGIADARQRRWGCMLTDIAGFTLMTVALLFSMSRGGVVAYVGGIGVLMLLVFLRSSKRVKAALVATVAAILCGATLLAIQQEQVRERLLSPRSPTTAASLQERIGAWKDAAGMLQCYPLLGVGPNAFYVTYPQHRTSSSRAARDFAENEYVQIMSETGVVGSTLLALFLFLLWQQSRRALSEAHDANGLHFAPACIGAVAAATTHALVDFPLHLPLYAITAATLAGCLWPQPGDPASTGTTRWPHGVAILIAALVLSLGEAIRLDSPSVLGGAAAPQITRAMVWAPTSALAWRRLCAKLSMGSSKAEQQLGERCLTQAAVYDPNNYPLWRRLGAVREALGDNRGANAAYRRVEALRDWIKLPVLPEED